MNSFRDHFLLAMPSLVDQNFSHTLTYICEHDESGALGIVINQPLDLCLADLLEQMDGAAAQGECGKQRIMFGGPVQEERGFILHSPVTDWDSTIQVSDQVALSTSRDALLAIAENRGPQYSLIALGYAGWGAGQLEEEMAANSWLSSPASSEILFHTPWERRLHAAAASLGIDYGQISSDIGHA